MEIRPNVRIFYNSVIALDGTTNLIASTLWAKIPPGEEYLTEHCVSDFKRICNGNFRLSSQRFNEEHERCLSFIKKAEGKSIAHNIIVAIHHVPSFALMSEEFRGSSINGAFTTELCSYIADSRINFWIYGHSHRNIEATICKTQCVSNQLGYVFQNEHHSFRRNAVIEI